MKKKELIALLQRSMDTELSREEQDILSGALSGETWLRREKERLVRLRAAAAQQEYAFAPGFEERVLQRMREWKVVRPNGAWNRSMTLWFQRVAVAGAAAILLLILNGVISSGSFSFNEMTGFDVYSEEEAISYLLFEK